MCLHEIVCVFAPKTQETRIFFWQLFEELGLLMISVWNNFCFFFALKKAADYLKAVLLNSRAQSPSADTLDYLTFFLLGQLMTLLEDVAAFLLPWLTNKSLTLLACKASAKV